MNTSTGLNTTEWTARDARVLGNALLGETVLRQRAAEGCRKLLRAQLCTGQHLLGENHDRIRAAWALLGEDARPEPAKARITAAPRPVASAARVELPARAAPKPRPIGYHQRRKPLASDTTLIVFGHVCRRTGVSLRDLLSDGRTDPQADARRRAARIFYRLGYGVQQIAYALGRNHSTVCHMLGRLAK